MVATRVASAATGQPVDAVDLQLTRGDTAASRTAREGDAFVWSGYRIAVVAIAGPGTTVHVQLTLASTRRTERAGRGIIVLEATLCDETERVYHRGELTMLIRTRPARWNDARDDTNRDE